MTRKAVVASIGESWIDLLSIDEVEKENASCDESSSCGHSGCGCQVSGRPFKAAKPDELTLQPGDTVEVASSSARALGASIIVFGIPIFMAVAGWMLLSRLLPNFSEILSAAGAGAGLAAGIILTLLWGRMNRYKELPKIITLVEKARS